MSWDVSSKQSRGWLGSSRAVIRQSRAQPRAWEAVGKAGGSFAQTGAVPPNPFLCTSVFYCPLEQSPIRCLDPAEPRHEWHTGKRLSGGRGQRCPPWLCLTDPLRASRPRDLLCLQGTAPSSLSSAHACVSTRLALASTRELGSNKSLKLIFLGGLC